jgi:hypothetical protein
VGLLGNIGSGNRHNYNTLSSLGFKKREGFLREMCCNYYFLWGVLSFGEKINQAI